MAVGAEDATQLPGVESGLYPGDPACLPKVTSAEGAHSCAGGRPGGLQARPGGLRQGRGAALGLWEEPWRGRAAEALQEGGADQLSQLLWTRDMGERRRGLQFRLPTDFCGKLPRRQIEPEFRVLVVLEGRKASPRRAEDAAGLGSGVERGFVQ